MKEYNIVVASDCNYIGFVSILFASILSNKKEDENIIFHVLANNIPSPKIQQLKEQIGNNDLYVYPITDFQKRLNTTLPDTIAVTSYARLFLAEILPESVNEVLYLDCDIIVNQSLSRIFSLDISNYAVAGVLDTLPNKESKRKIELSENDPYINAGVLYINLRKWRTDQIKDHFMTFLLQHNGCVHHHDQGIINAVLDKSKLIIGPEFNLTSNYFTHKYNYLKKRNNPFYTYEEIERAKKNPIIIHFTEGFLDRPWVIGSKHPFKNKFLIYKKASIIADEPLQISKKNWYVKLLGYEFTHLPLIFYQTTSLLLSLLSKLIKK